MAQTKKYELVTERVEHLVSAGTLKIGERIPSVRKMAEQMDVSVMTVLEGYRRLEDRGVIESRPQSGYYVRPELFHDSQGWVRLPEARKAKIAMQTDDVRVPPFVESLIAQVTRNDLVPLGAGVPDPSHFPSEELSLRMSRVVRSDPCGVNRYCVGGGNEHLRVMLSRQMLDVGCEVDPGELIVTSGATQALLLALRAVTHPGDAVAVESPGYYGFFGILQFLNLRAVEIPCDPQTGMFLPALEQTLQQEDRVACVLLSSNFSNPTGATMPDENKTRLIELCSEYDVSLIEDGTYGELSFDLLPPKALKAFESNRVIHIGSCSKILAPGYRIAWLAGGRHHRDLLRCHGLAALSVPLPNQLTIASFLEDGSMARHLRRLRKIYSENLRLFQSEVARHFPDGARTSNPSGGHYLWVELPSGGDSPALAKAALEKGISIAPGVIFSSRGFYKRFLRLNCGVVWSERIESALRQLGVLANLGSRK